MGVIQGHPRRVSVHTATVREVIQELEHTIPGISFSLCHETGELRPYINIFVDTENIRDLQGLDTRVPEAATISILLSVAGG
jgi:molybdopterin synthase sulfur carrier subunit